ncbi:ADP-ribose pyrophosphatase of COG1058 family [hydrothermal vent metagenome]|uniref:ADP-ribose pyrophosphatase of COG1058 family n=1 Tax=hydrothermal vent metagenome TaxID=652676 RepID=A0A3B0TGZ8_9ZZZZ
MVATWFCAKKFAIVSMGKPIRKMPENSNNTVTAAALIIGDEILSGRTADKNIATIARACTEHGIALKEARVIGDEKADIIEAINALRKKYRYVFTSGGIGPTHDDITADAIAAAFGVDLQVNKQALQMMEQRYGKRDISPSRERMARIPQGASLIKNPLTAAPGFRLENVMVMAGVPQIMEAMLGEIVPELAGGETIFSAAIAVGVGESVIAQGLKSIQDEYGQVKIGSYPRLGKKAPISGEKTFFGEVVLRSSDKVLLNEARAKVQALIDRAHKKHGVELGDIAAKSNS